MEMQSGWEVFNAFHSRRVSEQTRRLWKGLKTSQCFEGKDSTHLYGKALSLCREIP